MGGAGEGPVGHKIEPGDPMWYQATTILLNYQIILISKLQNTCQTPDQGLPYLGEGSLHRRWVVGRLQVARNMELTTADPDWMQAGWWAAGRVCRRPDNQLIGLPDGQLFQWRKGVAPAFIFLTFLLSSIWLIKPFGTRSKWHPDCSLNPELGPLRICSFLRASLIYFNPRLKEPMFLSTSF